MLFTLNIVFSGVKLKLYKTYSVQTSQDDCQYWVEDPYECLGHKVKGQDHYNLKAENGFRLLT
jgi:hypothetical protein